MTEQETPDDPFLEELLFETGRRLEDIPAPELDDGEAAAYRHGELRGDERERVEQALVNDGAVRARLAREAGVPAPQPRPEVKQRVLASFAQAFESAPAAGEGEPSPGKGTLLPWRGRSAAGRSGSGRYSAWIALAASILLAVVWLRDPVEPLPGDVRWSTEASGLAQVRGEEETRPEELELLPETLLRLEAAPERAVPGVEAVVYGRRHGEPVRALDLVVEQVDGAVRLEVVAREIVGSDPHAGSLVLVIGRPGHLPSANELGRALDAVPFDTDSAPRTDTWRAHVFPYRLLSPP